MRRGAALFALAAAACGGPVPAVPAATPHPLRVMSVNLCADQLVLALLTPDRIASVSWLARDPAESLMARAAARVPVNRGTAEDVLAERPDLVIAGSFTTPALRGMLKRLGWPMLEIGEAQGIDEVRRVTRQVAAALDERARGEALIARMDADLAALRRDPGPPIGVVAWDRSGFSAGAGSLYDVLLATAGADNLAKSAGFTQRPDVEQLLRLNPALLVQGTAAGGDDLGGNVAQHRLVRRYWSGRVFTMPQAAYACGTPMSVAAAFTLRDDLRRAARGHAGPALPFAVPTR